MITINLIEPETALDKRRRLNLEAVKRYQDKYPERVKSSQNPIKRREAGRRHDLINKTERYGAARRYGLTQTQAENIVNIQGGCCKICGEPLKGGRFRHIDHKHVIDIKTGKVKNGCKAEEVRGILCSGCNTGLGKFNDDPKLLERAAEYVRKGGAI